MGTLKKLISEMDDLKLVPLVIPEWNNVTIYLKPMPSALWDAKIAEVKRDHGGDIQKRPNWRAWLVVQSICEEDGSRAFDDGDAAMLGKKSSAALQRIFDKLSEINGLSEKAVKEIEKNSEETPAESSPSDSELS
jgi:hypothetical protein